MDLEKAATTEAESLAARQELRHSLREVMPTLNRRLELAVGLALANVGGSVTPDGNNSITELVTLFSENVESYTQQQELAEALLTLKKINDVKDSDGENPAMRRALAAQEQRVRALAEQLNPQSDSAQPAASGSRLQIVKTSSDLAFIQKQNREWLRDYDRKLDELVQLVAHTESFTPA
jgi:hypothetical protein